MKRTLLMIGIACWMTGCATTKRSAPQADEPMDSRAAAERLLDVLQMEENFNHSIGQAVTIGDKMFEKMDCTEEQKEAAIESYKASMNVMMKDFSWANMKDMFLDIYAEVFTAEELNDITAFYESPEGQKFVAKQPELTRLTMQKMQALVAKMMPRIEKEAAAAVENIKPDPEQATADEQPME